MYTTADQGGVRGASDVSDDSYWGIDNVHLCLRCRGLSDEGQSLWFLGTVYSVWPPGWGTSTSYTRRFNLHHLVLATSRRLSHRSRGLAAGAWHIAMLGQVLQNSGRPVDSVLQRSRREL